MATPKPTVEDISQELFGKLLEKQEHCFNNIKRLINNYDKNGPYKTAAYLDSRMKALETYWREFQSNHEVLLKNQIKEDKYFKQDIYSTTLHLYDKTMEDMIARKLQLETESPEDPENPEHQEGLEDEPKTEISAECNKILRQQMLNFNALERVVSKIDLELITDKWELEDILQSLKTKWDAIDRIHWELDYELKGENWRQYKLKYLRWETAFDINKRALNEKIWASVHYNKTTPNIEIPSFNGDYNQWVSFRDLFLETIHKNPLLSKSQKMQHLKTKLTGEARKLIQHLSISSENYDSAWSLIEHRYENKRLLFSSYMNALLNLPNIQQPSAQNIKKLHDTLLECLNGLHNLGLETETWDPLIVHLLLPKLDPASYADYIHDLENPRELPQLQEFIHFLEAKFMAFEAVKQNQGPQKPSTFQKPQQRFHNFNNEKRSSNFNKSEKWTKSYHTVIRYCPLCNKEHVLMNCKTFLSLNIKKRNELVAKKQLCKNCLFSHGDQKCTSSKVCKLCNLAHHTLLHDDLNNKHNSTSSPQTQPSTSGTSNHVNQENQEILLTTVQLKVRNYEGNYVTLRALLDQGSQVTLVTENAAQRLRLPRRKMNAVVSGVGTALENCKGLLTLYCKSLHSDFTFETDALIMRKLINNLPNKTLKTINWDYLENLKLADPDFNVPGQIDILLGAEIYSKIIDDGVLRRGADSPVAQNTKLGWILSGGVKTFNCMVTLNELDSISKFWESEDISNSTQLTGESICEQHYAQTTERTSSGRYVVQMPLKSDIDEKLGKSRPQAVAQFLQLERKMAKQKYFAKLYKSFIQEYIDLGHMIPATTNKDKLEAYLPHHGVLREGSTTTKLRTVFNASMPTSTKYSLNDLMETGPNLQKDIFTLILTWRTYKYALTADIEKMFRAILINERQQSLQKIIWRFLPSEPLQEWQLCTVTYGTKAAPYLAMRTLQQLALDEGHAYPLAEKALRNQFYMDDVITGHDTIEEAKSLQKQLYFLLQKGGFILRKWASNEPVILQDLNEKQRNLDNVFNFKQDEPTKTLGLGWNTQKDVFCYNLTLPQTRTTRYTKRMLLSEISKIYDPLGWIAPITIKAKLIFQKVWNISLQWDDLVPIDIEKEWLTIRNELNYLQNMTIPRWIHVFKNQTIELHGFCDSSEKAYSCIVYSRTCNENDTWRITQLAAKTKAAPIKAKTSIPRLELCGALLLAKLVEKISAALAEHELKITCWTDSQVVLAWLQGNNCKWEKYITNRTTQINNLVPAKQWRYVKSKDNPADCATKGLLPNQLVNFILWWEGPQWLKNWKETTENTTFTTENERDLKCLVIKSENCTGGEITKQLIERCSHLTHVIRSLAWVLRYKAILCHKTRLPVSTLTLNELEEARTLLINSVQYEYFFEDIENLKKVGSVSTKSKLLNLTPYLDEKGTLRIGGRLKLSSLSEQAKHPAILPHDGRFTQLVIELAHKQTLHGGARLTLAQTRQLYWIISGNRAVKAVVRKCVRCHRFKATTSQQIMGNLPAVRVTPSRPFTHTGVDYTGHVNIKLNRGRGVKCTKGYIAIFICMATKAVHIELVSDLSSQAFIAALKRLCARRGTPKHIYSDNGTNFKGAANILQLEFQKYKTMTSTDFFHTLDELKIEWHFIAPRWPTAAGIWEASVKSMKHHLFRVMGEQKLDFEQLSTLLAQIEGCLNSRPLCPLTEDPEDLEYLTPGHFLTGSPIMSLPQETITDINLDLRNRWRIVEQMNQHIWNRWSKEYLHQLQTKSKWLQPKPNIQKGDLVLVKEDNLPSGKWAMGRVIDTHPGEDGYVRVVTLKTQGNTIKRPVTKLSPLPVNKYEEQLSANKHELKPKDNLPHDDKNINNNIRSDNAPVTRSRRTRAKLSNYVNILLFTMCTLMTTCAQPILDFKLTPIEGNRPIYFDEIGELQMIHDEWNLLIYFNITTYWEGTKQITRYLTNLDDLCKRMDRQPCLPVIDQLKHELKQLEEYNELLLTPHLSRKKRGYINGIGSLARTLFGVLDEEFAEKYQQDIQKIQTNENYLLELIKNQTSIIETENDIIKNNDKFMRHQLVSIHEYIRRTNASLNQITYKVEVMSTMNDFNAASLTAALIITNLKRTQDMLLNTLTNVYNGHLDVHLVMPKQLIYQLHIIAAKVSKGLSLPNQDNNIEAHIQDVYLLLYVRARITTSYLLLEVHIPLTKDEEYKIYRPISLPMHLKNQTCTSVILTLPYIAVYLKNNAYMQLESKDLDHCMQINEKRYVCNTNYPVHSLRSENKPCEAQIIDQQQLNCNIRTENCTDKWIKLKKPNRWLYFCCKACQARILCDENRISTAKLDHIGILDLKEGCVLQNKDTTIHAYNHFGSQLNIDLEVPQITDTNLHFNELLTSNYSEKQLINTPNSYMEETYAKLDKSLKGLEANEKLPTTDLTSHDIHQFSVLYLVVGGLISMICIYLVKRYKGRRLNNQSDTQQPQHVPENTNALSPDDIEMQRQSGSCEVCPQRVSTDRRFSFGK